MKIIKFIPIAFLLIFLNNISFADTSRDCSKYSNKTLVGQYDKWRCEKGKPERKKFKLNDLNILKKKN